MAPLVSPSYLDRREGIGRGQGGGKGEGWRSFRHGSVDLLRTQARARSVRGRAAHRHGGAACAVQAMHPGRAKSAARVRHRTHEARPCLPRLKGPVARSSPRTSPRTRSVPGNTHLLVQPDETRVARRDRVRLRAVHELVHVRLKSPQRRNIHRRARIARPVSERRLAERLSAQRTGKTPRR